MQSYEIISKIGKVLTLFVCNLTLYVANFAFFRFVAGGLLPVFALVFMGQSCIFYGKNRFSQFVFPTFYEMADQLILVLRSWRRRSQSMW